MKKLIGLLLTCTAFAYSGERIVMELPPEISASSEAESPTSLHYTWSCEEGDIEINNCFQNPEMPFTIDGYLEGDLEVLEIIEQSPNSVTLISNHMVDNSCSVEECAPSEEQEVTFCEKVIVTDDCYHIIKSENLDWLSFIQTAEIGVPEQTHFYKGEILLFDHNDLVRMMRSDEEDGLFEVWFHEEEQFCLTTASSFRDPEEDETLEDIFAELKESFEENYTVTYEVLQESASEMIVKIGLDIQGFILVGFIKVLQSEQYAHAISVIGLEETLLFDFINSVQISH